VNYVHSSCSGRKVSIRLLAWLLLSAICAHARIHAAEAEIYFHSPDVHASLTLQPLAGEVPGAPGSGDNTEGSSGPDDPPALPSAGITFPMSGDLICTRTDPGYHYGKGQHTSAGIVSDHLRDTIIAAYKSLPSQRCPEYGIGSHHASYPYWVNQVGMRILGLLEGPMSESEAEQWIHIAIPNAGTSETLAGMHDWCQRTADARYGQGTTRARFIERGMPGYTGNTCIVITVN